MATVHHPSASRSTTILLANNTSGKLAKEMNERVWTRGANWHDDDGYMMSAQWPLVSLRLNDEGGSLRCSLPGLLGRAFERIFSGPKVEFEWSEVELVERVRTVGFVPGVRFKIVQQGEPKMFVLDASDGTVAEILDYAQARGANVSHLKRRMWRYL
jgi:hypothetical protein